MRLALFEQHMTIGCESCIDRLQALVGIASTVPGKDHFVEPVN
jgi:hypothetical protein